MFTHVGAVRVILSILKVVTAEPLAYGALAARLTVTSHVPAATGVTVAVEALPVTVQTVALDVVQVTSVVGFCLVRVMVLVVLL